MPRDDDWIPPPGAMVREPPHSFPLEQSILGGLLLNNQAYWRVAEFLRAEHFADPLHGRLYAAIGTLVERNQVADIRTIGALFAGDETLAAGHRPNYVAELTSAAIHIMDVSDYARQVHDLFLRRQLIDVGETMVNDAFAQDAARPAAALIEEAEGKLFAVAGAEGTDDRLVDNKRAWRDTFEEIQEAMREREDPDSQRRRITVGLRDVDSRLSIKPGHLVIVAGAASMGKSSLADHIAETNERNGVPGAIFAKEMSRTEWNQRRLARHTGIEERRIDSGDLTTEEFQALWQAREAMEVRPLWIDDSTNLTPARLRGKLRRLKRQHDIRWCVVDYLQLLKPDETGRRDANRTQDVGAIARSLKMIAGELGIAVLAVSQLSRAVNARDDKRPDLGDLRESGELEQHANSVIFVYREEYYLSRSKPAGKGGKPPTPQEESEHLDRLEKCRGIAEIICGKQRRGLAPWTARVRWDGARTRFLDLAPDEPPPHQDELL